MSDFDVLSFLNVRSVKLDLMVNEEKTHLIFDMDQDK